jgi:uncharacterized protein
MQPDPSILKSLLEDKMPFGKHKGEILANIPVHYLEWMSKKGFPKGRIGMQLETLLVIKSNGLTHLLRPLKS